MTNKKIEDVVKSAKRKVNHLWWFVLAFVVGSGAALIIFEANSVADLPVDSRTTLTSIYYLYLLAAIPFSFYWFHRKTLRWSKQTDEQQKTVRYTKGACMRLIIIASVGFFGILIYKYFVRESSLLYCVAISLSAFLFCRTSEKQIYNDLKIKDLEDNI
ncbi:MAG: hypothetical protein LBS01_03965 [Prevotellaceae bacterium]|jgi:hypothetical protein|nr:hypothetical protein [Prevotellaceae bacterium]